MTSGELTDTAVAVYQELGGIILRNTAVPTLVSLSAIVFILAYVFPTLGVTAHPQDIHAQLGEALFTILIGFGVGAPLFALGLSYSGAFVTGLVSDYMNGELPRPEYHAKEARKLLPKVLGLVVLQVLTAMLGLVIAVLLVMLSALLSEKPSSDTIDSTIAACAIFAGVIGFIAMPIVLARQILALPSIVIERLSPWKGLKRSKGLMKATKLYVSGYGNAWAILFLIGFLILFVYGGIRLTLDTLSVSDHVSSFLSNSSFHDLGVQALNSVPWFLTLWTLVPVWCTSATLLYYDRRTRAEGYDIEMLAKDMTPNVKQNRFEL
jgi:hypothetical protein